MCKIKKIQTSFLQNSRYRHWCGRSCILKYLINSIGITQMQRIKKPLWKNTTARLRRVFEPAGPAEYYCNYYTVAEDQKNHALLSPPQYNYYIYIFCNSIQKCILLYCVFESFKLYVTRRNLKKRETNYRQNCLNTYID